MKLNTDELFAINYLCAHQIGSYATTLTGLRFEKKKAQKKLIELHEKLEKKSFANDEKADDAYDNGQLIDDYFAENNLNAGQIMNLCSKIITDNTKNYSEVWRLRFMAFVSNSKPLHEQCGALYTDLFQFLSGIVRGNVKLK